MLHILVFLTYYGALYVNLDKVMLHIGQEESYAIVTGGIFLKNHEKLRFSDVLLFLT